MKLVVFFSGSAEIDSESLLYQNVLDESVINYDTYSQLDEESQNNYCIMSFQDVLEAANDVDFEQFDVKEEDLEEINIEE